MNTDRYEAFHKHVDDRKPTTTDRKIDLTLKNYMDINMILETDEEMERRSVILKKVEEIFLTFIKFVGVEIVHMAEDEVETAGGGLVISGSQKLDVRDPGADIDTICVAPNFVTRDHFFSHLRDQFQHHPGVTDFSAVETALVPIMSFNFERVPIDLLFARLASNVVPTNLSAAILDDNILRGLDQATEKTLNGPRVTQMISELVGRSNFPTFLIVLRCIRKWAKVRGLYGNKFGYLGGINCNLLVTFLCQLYPFASPSTLLVKFFQVFGSQWKWPNPIKLNNIQENRSDNFSEQRQIWNPEENPYHVMPIITPAYPAMNSTASVSAATLQIMKREMVRAHDIIKEIIVNRGENWSRLFEKSDFFLQYSHYLCCNIIGVGEDIESSSWIGFVESRIRRLPGFLDNLPIQQPVHFFPVKSKTEKSLNSICYFIGFDFDPELLVLGDKDISDPYNQTMYRFESQLNDPERGYTGPRVEGLDFYVEFLKWKQLPKVLFEPYGGFETAKEMRNNIKKLKNPEKYNLNNNKVEDEIINSTPSKIDSNDSETVKIENNELDDKKRKRSEDEDIIDNNNNNNNSMLVSPKEEIINAIKRNFIDINIPSLLPNRENNVKTEEKDRKFVNIPKVSWVLLDQSK
jgi:poly(A) polymerase